MQESNELTGGGDALDPGDDRDSGDDLDAVDDDLDPGDDDLDPGDDDLDPVWRALASPVRRRILDRLRDGPCTTGDLAARFAERSRFAVMQHLKVLEEADLVRVRRSGRERYNYLNPVPIQRIHERWVSRYQRPWAEALVGLKHELEVGAADAPADTGRDTA
jgi:DNA-binding transcriptional ArsR family regulator